MEYAVEDARILLVEDEGIVALDMRNRLTAMGFRIVGIAASGEDAISIASSEKPDLILMDIKLQGDLDGLDAADRIHDFADVPIIFVTAFADETTLRRAKGTDAFGYILKPFQEREVFIAIEMALSKHRLERELRLSREWLKGTVNAISDSIIAVDSSDDIVFMNEAALRLLDIEEARYVGKSVAAFCSFETSEALTSLANAHYGTRAFEAASNDNAWVFLSTTEKRVPVELRRTEIIGVRGSIEGRVLCIREIADIIAAEATRSRLSAIVASSRDAIFSFTPELRIVSWNFGAELLYGFTGPEMIGRPLHPLFDGEKELERFKEIVDLVQSGRDVGNFETVRKCRSGKNIVVAVSLSRIPNVEGKNGEIACIERDISAMKEYEASLILAKSNAEEASKAKAQFLSNMSHELRTPLNSILGMIDLVREQAATSEEQKEFLDIAFQSAENLLSMINAILDFSKIEAGKMRLEPTVFDPVSTLEACLVDSSLQARRKGLNLYFRADPSIPESVRGDARWFKQIIDNLVSNAVKFTEAGSVSVDLSAEKASDGASALVALKVSDTGIGISADKMSAIWEGFTQLDGSSTRAYGGTGLGLSIVKSLVELMGGSVDASSVQGSGSVFRVLVPMEIVGEPKKGSPIKSGISVAMVSLRREERSILTELLESWGCRVEVIEDLSATTGFPQSRDDGPDFIVMDEKELERFFASSMPRTRAASLIVLSSLDSRRDSRTADYPAAVRFLDRPIRRSALIAALTNAPAEAGKGSRGFEPIEGPVHPEPVLTDAVVACLERFRSELDTIGHSPGPRLESAALRCRSELDTLHAAELSRVMFKITLACRRDDALSVNNLLAMIDGLLEPISKKE